ncbi:MAG: sigma-70 family RNA polymerase sigma factor [Anaerolineales bacterium]|nr:MAG: sigma-70 family RNA polymerase sigma factor [Anaerolineales bacterium]
MLHHSDHTVNKEVYLALLEKADTQGYLTTQDLIEAYRLADDDSDRTDRLVEFFTKKGIDVLDEIIEGDSPDKPITRFLKEIKIQHGQDILSIEDTIDIYLREMSRVPLLDEEDEVLLAGRIEKGRKAEKILASSAFKTSNRKRQKFEDLIQEGALAREHLIKANTRLVVSIAKKYIGRGVPFLDLIQEGNLGLMKAVEKFDYRRGFRFSTYATWWIRQTITRSIADQGRTIRLPVHMSDRIRQLYRVSHELEQQLGRPPTQDEIAYRMDVPTQKVQFMLQVSLMPLSLESPVGDEEDSELGMFVEDQITPTPSQVVYQNMLKERVNEVLATLTPREARILRLRFGLDDNRSYTLEEVGQKFGLTRERIRQIEGKALRRLRHPRRSRQLREYL